MEPLLFIGLVGLLVWVLGGRRYYRAIRLRQALGRLSGYTASYSMVGANGAGFAIDAVSKKIAFVSRTGSSVVYQFSDILSVEACRNGVWFTKTNRGSQVVGALVGKALFGPLGFDIGGRTGSTTMSERIGALSLKIYVQDIRWPMYEILFYSGTPLELGNRKLASCISLLNEWYARINLVISSP